MEHVATFRVAVTENTGMTRVWRQDIQWDKTHVPSHLLALFFLRRTL